MQPPEGGSFRPGFADFRIFTIVLGAAGMYVCAMRLLLSSLAILVLASAFVYKSAAHQPVAPASVPVKQSAIAPADSVGLKAFDNHLTSLQSFLQANKGKVVYVDIWASWCGPCRQQMPFSHELQEKLKDENVVFLYISADDNEKAWQRSAEQFGLTGANSFLLANGRYNPLVSEWEIQSIPRYVIFDKEGKIAYKDAPRPSEKQTYSILKKLAK